MKRKLAAVLAADVVGYSRLMAADEAGTFARLKALRRELVEPEIAKHRGRVVKLMGDGVLVEFASAVDAVESAVGIQRRMTEHNRDEPDDRKIWLRVGVNLGDIIIDDDDIYGDGVNLAARLEGLAEPGGVCISDLVHSQVLGRLDSTFESGGLQQVKNIDAPIKVWSWSPAGLARAADPEVNLPDKPALVVLPFANMTGESAGEVVADGFSEDLITAASRIGSLFVVARNSSFTYKGRAVDVKQVARELGVRYVLEGSIRNLRTKFRVNAQLIDAATGHHLWAEMFDSVTEAFDEEQDEFIRAIIASAQTQILLHEGEAIPAEHGASRNVPALLSRGWNRIYRMTPDEHLAETALAMSPGDHRTHALLAASLFHKAYLGYFEDWSSDVDRARRAAERAVELHEASEQSHWILGLVLMLERDHEGAVAELQRAIEINPNFSVGYGSLGTVLAWGGRAEEAIETNEVALRLNPRDPGNFFRFLTKGVAHFTAGRYEEAAAWATRSLRSKRIFRIPYLVRIAALAHTGDLDRARSAADDMRAHVPEVTRAYVDRLPFIRTQDREALVRGLELAGVLDQVTR